MNPYAAIASSVINVGAGLLGNFMASADEDQMKALQQEAYRLYGKMDAPTLEKVLAEKVDKSAYEDMPGDFGNKAARNLAISRMMEEGTSGGMTPEDSLALEEARRAGAAQASQGQAAIRQEMQMRGKGGAGEVVGQLLSQQAGNDTSSMAGMRAAADARQRKLQAIAQGGAMAASAEGQDTDKASRKAESLDRINQFNANLAQQTKIYNADRQQQDWQNRLALADRKYGATQQRAEQYGESADRTRKKWGAAGQGLSTAVNGMGMMGGG